MLCYIISLSLSLIVKFSCTASCFFTRSRRGILNVLQYLLLGSC